MKSGDSNWREVWRRGIAPQLTREQLTALRDALACDDPRLVQGSTTVPPPLMVVQNWPVEAACALGFCAWSQGKTTVREVEEGFAAMCYEADQLLGEPAAVRWFLNWFDDTPRAIVRRELLAEIDAAMAERG